MILIGSRALALRVGSHMYRECLDFDFIATRREMEEWLWTGSGGTKQRAEWSGQIRKWSVPGPPAQEFELLIPGTKTSTEMFAELVETDKETIQSPFGMVPSLDLLFALKSSHRFRKDNPHFWKTLTDYHFMRKLGATIRPEHAAFCEVREKETYSYKLHKAPNLNVSKADFFRDDQVDYVYDHDDLHWVVKMYETPAYMAFRREEAEVACSKEKFEALPNHIKLASVIEESCVLAIERSIIPHTGVLTPYEAFKFALSKVCSSISSGWWRSYAYESALDALKEYPENYVDRFRAAAASGSLKLHEKAST